MEQPAPTSRSTRRAAPPGGRTITGREEDGAASGETDPWVRWARRWVHWMDDRFAIPGTRQRVGLDALIGFLLPTAGDVVTGIGALALWMLAWRYRVPAPVMGRMLRNVLTDVVVGSVPIAGDAFDVLWRANRRNLRLLEPYLAPESAARGWRVRDYAMLAAGLVVGAALIVAPIVLLVWLILRASE